MSEPSIQLDLENALKDFIVGMTLFTPTVPVFASHSTEFSQTGTYVAISSNVPDWYLLGGRNPLALVTFECATEVSDPDVRGIADNEHSQRTGALIDLFSEQRQIEIMGDLNPPPWPFPDNRPWKGLGFDSWCENGGDDTRSETQVVTRLIYEFVVHLEN
jgi:hypothetical protein